MVMYEKIANEYVVLAESVPVLYPLTDVVVRAMELPAPVARFVPELLFAGAVLPELYLTLHPVQLEEGLVQYAVRTLVE